MFEKTLKLVDEGMNELAEEDFDMLLKKYPHNYIVAYERLFNMYCLERFKDVIKDGKPLLKHKYADALIFQLMGNAYDIISDRKKAEKTYKEGLKRFPGNGMLYLELGNLNLLDANYGVALDYYNQGIEGMPDFASNYYRAATIYFSTINMKVWGLVYAEAEVLLAPQNEVRHREMADMMVECLKESLRLDYGDEPKMEVSLVPAREMRIDKDTKLVYLAFPGIYEGAIGIPLFELYKEKAELTLNIPQLAFIRKGLVDAYFAVTDNIFGNSMYLLEYQKQVIDAGHWDAYNYFLFGYTYPEEFDKWYATNKSKYTDFVSWYNNHTFRLGDGRTVCIGQIYNCYKPVELMESMVLQSKFVTDVKKDDIKPESTPVE